MKLGWLWALGLVVGCSVEVGGGDPSFAERPDARVPDARVDETPPAERPPVEANPPACVGTERWRDIRFVRQLAEDSVHELVTCGQAQMAVVGSMVAIVLFSNPQFFDEATVEELRDLMALVGLVGSSPFTPTATGRHVMPINERSSFAVSFYAPGATAEAPVLRDNVFDLESYLMGARVETSLSWQEMKDDLTRKNVYTLTWQGPGPLAGVMFPEGLPAEPRLELALSLWDFAYLLGFHDEAPDFGPFAKLAALVMDSDVSLYDDRGGAVVEYAFGGQRGVLADLLEAGRLGFELRSLRATNGQVTLEGDAADLHYVSRGALAGGLVYRVPGEEVVVVDDFGAGAAYPEVSAYCPGDRVAPEHEHLVR